MLSELTSSITKLFGESSDFSLNTGKNNSFAHLSDVPRLFEILPYEAYDPKDQFFINKRTTGFILQGEPIVGASLADQEQLSDFFRQNENLPEGSSLQFLFYASPYIAPQVSYWASARQQKFSKLTQRRADFMMQRSQSASDGQLFRDYKLIISYTLPERLTSVVEKQKLIQIREILQGFLLQIGLPTRSLCAQGFLNEMRGLFKLGAPTHDVFYNPDISLNRQLFDKTQAWHVHKDHIEVEGQDTRVVKSYVPQAKPTYWALGHMDKLLGDLLKPQSKISCPFIMHYGLHMVNHQMMEKNKALSKRESLENTLKNQLTKWVPGLEEEYEEFSDISDQLIAGERIIKAGLSVSLFSDEENITFHERQLSSIWRYSGWNIHPTTYDHLSVFVGSLPMMWTLGHDRPSKLRKQEDQGAGNVLEKLGRIEKTLTKEAQNLLPILGEWKGQVAPGLPLVGRRGQLFFWNPFDGMFLPGKELPSRTSNYNVCISGKSGSGKSFFCNELILNSLSVGGKAFVLDKGNSFKNMCTLLGGHHIDFTANSLHSLNPFTHIPEGESQDEESARAEQLNIVVQVLKTMVMPHRDPDEVQSSFLEEAVQSVWTKKQSKASIDDVYTWLKSHEDSRAVDLSRMLMMYAGSGKYAKFFNRPATVNLNHDLVVIETQNLMNHEDLRCVLVQMMIVQVSQRMISSDRKSPFLVLIDEAWELIQGNASGKFIAAFVRTARKYRASLTLATQNLSDYFRVESPGATAAFENSDWKCVFRQETVSHLDKFGQTEGERHMAQQIIGSLLPASTFSEMALYGQEVKGVVGRLFCDEFSQLLYSTKASDFAEIKAYLDQGNTVEDAIECVLRDRGDQPQRRAA